MSQFLAPKGYKASRFDKNSVEPHCLAQLSKDTNLLRIYGKEARHQDVYLFTASHFPNINVPVDDNDDTYKNDFDKVRSLYNLDGFTSLEEFKRVKTLLDSERTFAKAPFLGWCYGLTDHGLSRDINIPLYQATQIMNIIDKTFPGKDRYHKWLLRERKKSGGWVINGRGNPICVANRKRKDIVNSVIQSTGVQLLNRCVYHISNEIKRIKLDSIWSRPNYHDEAILFVREDEIERYNEVIDYGFDRLNDELGWDVIIKHGGVSVDSSWIVRCS